jgi:DNA-directed RNA polymerase subunit RPC12/RpoP
MAKFRGEGRIDVEKHSLRVVGRRVYPLPIRLAFCLTVCVLLPLASAVITSFAVVPGFLLLYLLVEFIWLKRENVLIAFTDIVELETNPARRLVAIGLRNNKVLDPLAFTSTDWRRIADLLTSQLLRDAEVKRPELVATVQYECSECGHLISGSDLAESSESHCPSCGSTRPPVVFGQGPG